MKEHPMGHYSLVTKDYNGKEKYLGFDYSYGGQYLMWTDDRNEMATFECEETAQMWKGEMEKLMFGLVNIRLVVTNHSSDVVWEYDSVNE